MKDFIELVSPILGIVISCITIYQFFAKRPSVARLRQEEPSQLPQELHTVPILSRVSSSVSSVSLEGEHVRTRKYFFALVTFIVMPIVAFFILFFYTLWSNYSYTSQEATIANFGGALLAGSSLALMILLIAPSRRRAIIAVTTFVIIYSLVLLGVILLSATIYFSFPILDSSLAGGSVLAVIAASLVAFVILRGTPPSRQQYIFGLITFVLTLLVPFSGPILYTRLLSGSVTERTIVGGSTIALIVASISLLIVLFSAGTTRTYTVILVLFTIVYFVILLLLAAIHYMTYSGVLYLFYDASVGASTIAFVVGGFVAFFFLKRGSKR